MSAKDSDEKDEAETTSPETPSTDSVSTTSNASSTHKVKGEFAESDGTAVLGTNTAGSGTPVGIEGSVPNGAAGKGVVGTSLDDDTAYVDWAEGFGV